MKNYHTTLSEAGVRPSVQRVAVYSYLCEHPVHPTVETLYASLSPEYPTLSKTTIYNTLKLFEEKKLKYFSYIMFGHFNSASIKFSSMLTTIPRFSSKTLRIENSVGVRATGSPFRRHS